MTENKTKATNASVEDYLASRANGDQRLDCDRLIDMFKKITKQPPKIWGASIVGFGSYRYKYESGREDEWCLTGFAIRKSELVVYLLGESKERAGLLAKFGKHKKISSSWEAPRSASS